MNRLEALRLSVTDRQRELLDAVWHYYREHDHQWMPSRLLHQQHGGPSKVRSELEVLGGAIVWENNWNPSDGGSLYALTFLGVLLTSIGSEAEHLLVVWLDYLKERYHRDPLFKGVHSHEIETDKRLTADQVRVLEEVLPLSDSWLQHGGGGTPQWSFAPPLDIDSLAELSDSQSYVAEHVLEDFDYFGHSLPIDGRQRSEAISRRLRQPAPPRVFDFVVDRRLQEMLTADWQEANRVYAAANGWKSTILLCGGVLEGLLLYVLRRRKKRSSAAYRTVFPKGRQPNALDRWGLDELIQVAEQLGILGDSHLDHSRALTRYRNYVHPGKQLREQRQVSQDEATFAVTATRMCIEMLRFRVVPRRRGSGISSASVNPPSPGPITKHEHADAESDPTRRRGIREERVQRLLQIARQRPVRYGQLLSAARNSKPSAGPQRLLESLAGEEALDTDPALVTVEHVAFRRAADQLVACDKRVISQFIAAYKGKGTAVERKDIAEEIDAYERALRGVERSVEEYIAPE